MKAKYFFLPIFICLSVISFSQDKGASYKFHSINSVSLLNGENAVSAGLQSVNGIQKGNWFAGIGVGLDYYLYRTVPLFVDIRYEYGRKKNKFFAYADGGFNFEWAKEAYNDSPGFVWDGPNSDGEFHNGAYADAGLGYLIGSRKGNGGLALSLGYSYKSLEKTVTYLDWRRQQPTTDTYDYNLNRIVIKVGWKF